MTDPRQLLDDYAAETEWSAEALADIPREEREPKLVAALRAVLDRHPIGNPGVAAVAWCGGCGSSDTAPDWPCPTVQAIVTALETP